MKNKGIIYDKCKSFSIRIIALYKFLSDKNEFVMSKQTLRSATSIGANYSEALGAESPLDFIHKASISLKENYETQYWLDILHDGGYIEDNLFASLYSDSEELHKLLSSSILTMKKKIDIM